MTPSTTYRELVEKWKASTVEGAARLGPEEDPPPIWEIIGRDPEHDTLVLSEDNRMAGEVMPDLLRESRAAMVANVFFGYLMRPDGTERTERAIVVVVDPERVEMWHAPIVRSSGSPVVGPWTLFGGGPAEAIGGLAPALQEAMR